MKFRSAFAILSLAIAGLSPAFGQTITATLEGYVMDVSGASIPGAEVTVVNTATNATTRLETTAEGRFVAAALPAGPYSVAVEAPGFKRLERRGVVLQVNQSARIEIVLEVGDVTEIIEVSGEAPLLEAATSTVSQTIGSKNVVDLPLNQRNPYALVLLVPGVSGSVGFGFNNVNFSVNGGRPGTNEILLDGIPSSPTLVNPVQGYSVFPSVDSVQEFRVQTNNFSAEFGRSGGAVINMIFKSGTNELHGTVFEFLRNSRLDANDFFANSRGVELASFKRNQFGFSVGGPVVIPGAYNGRNKTFFFGAYEGLRERAASNLLTTVPTGLQQGGDFSQTLNAAGNLIQLYDPQTSRPSGAGFLRDPFPNNQIPANRFDPVSNNVRTFFPAPNAQGDPNTGQNNFATSASSPTDINQYDIKGDHIINDSNRFFVRVSRRILDIGLPDFFPQEQLIAQGGMFQPQKSLGGAADYTWNVSPTYLMNFRGGFGRMLLDFRPRSDGFDPTALGFPTNIRDNADRLMFPGVNFVGYQNLGNGGPEFRRNSFETFNGLIANTKISGGHTIKFGFEMRVLRVNNTEAGRASGLFNFNRAMTQGPNPTQASATAGDSFGSFLLGLGNDGFLTKNFKAVGTLSRYFAWYVGDDWKVSRKLTLNLGLRYELDVPRTERYDRMNVFDPFAPSPLAGPSGLPDLTGGLVFVGVDGHSRRQFATDTNNWAPRVGLAYQAADRLVVRSAFGVFYAPAVTAAGGTVGNFGFRSDTPYVGSLDGVTPNHFLSNPFPDGFISIPGSSLGLLSQVGSSLEAPLREAVVPYNLNWNLNLQYQLPSQTLIEVGYVGRRGMKLNEAQEGDYNLNQLRPEHLALGSQLLDRVPNPFFGLIETGPLTGPTVPQSFLLRPFPQFTVINPLFKIGAQSIYHAYQMRVEKRFSGGATMLLAYTAGKLIDDYSRTAVVGRSVGQQNIYDRRAERAISLQDVSQRLVVSYVYELPFGRGKAIGGDWGGVAHAFLGGWQVNGISTFQTGQPLIITTQSTHQAGSAVQRPHNTGQSAQLTGPVNQRLDEFFDTAVFTQPAPFTFGNAPRSLPDVRGPGTASWDISIFKNFALGERADLQFRTELFNAFNTPVFGFPVSALNNPQFGRINNQANTPRQIQFGLKLIF